MSTYITSTCQNLLRYCGVYKYEDNKECSSLSNLASFLTLNDKGLGYYTLNIDKSTMKI